QVTNRIRILARRLRKGDCCKHKCAPAFLRDASVDYRERPFSHRASRHDADQRFRAGCPDRTIAPEYFPAAAPQMRAPRQIPNHMDRPPQKFAGAGRSASVSLSAECGTLPERALV